MLNNAWRRADKASETLSKHPEEGASLSDIDSLTNEQTRLTASSGDRYSRQREREVEALPETLEGDEGLRREVPGAHVAEGFLEASGGTLAPEAPHQKIETRPTVLTHALDTAARARRHLASLTWRRKEFKHMSLLKWCIFTAHSSEIAPLRFTEVSTLSHMFLFVKSGPNEALVIVR